MDAFDLHRHVISDYADYTKSFVRIADQRIADRVADEIANGLLWPDPLLQLNTGFEPGRSIDQLVADDVLHRDCSRIFRGKAHGRPIRLYRHQNILARLSKTLCATLSLGF